MAVEGSTQVTPDNDQQIDISNPQPLSSLTKHLSESKQTTPEFDYGPWLLVTRRRSRARGCGGSSRVDHVTLRTATDSCAVDIESRGTASRNIRGRFESGGRGKFLGSHPSRHTSFTDTQMAPPTNSHTSLPIIDPHLEINPIINESISTNPINSLEAIPIPHYSSPSSLPNQITSPYTAREIGKNIVRSDTLLASQAILHFDIHQHNTPHTAQESGKNLSSLRHNSPTSYTSLFSSRNFFSFSCSESLSHFFS